MYVLATINQKSNKKCLLYADFKINATKEAIKSISCIIIFAIKEIKAIFVEFSKISGFGAINIV